MRLTVLLLSMFITACQKADEICATSPPYDDSKYEQWVAAREKAHCDEAN